MPIARKPSVGGGSVGVANTVKLPFTAKTNIAAGAVVAVVRDTVANTTELVLANAGTDGKMTIGFAVGAINSGDTAEIIVGRGSLVTPVVVGGGSLTPNQPVYLSTTDGAVTQTVPTGAGEVNLPLGRAISTTQMILTTDFVVSLS